MPAQSSVLSSQSFILALIVLIYLGLAGLFALRTPPWQAPDEPAHYNYAAQVAQRGCCPTIQPGDWDSAYLDQLKSASFAPNLLGDLDLIEYEDHQPPLYYLLQAVIYRVASGSLTAMRLFSALFGVGIIVCVYGAGVRLLPLRPQVALGAAAFAAFLPQHVAILASVSNDSLAWLLIAMTLLGTIIYLQDGAIKPWHLGLLVGLSLLTKVSTLFLLGLVPLAILLKGWSRRRIPVAEVLQFLAPALLLGGLWMAHNVNIYGFPDVFGLRQHDRVVVGQPRTAELIAQVGFGAYLSSAVQTTFNSFWGQFGWMALPLPAWVYPILLLVTLICVSGLGLAWVRARRPSVGGEGLKPSPTGKRLAVLILATAAALAFLAYVYYNTEFLQFQGRYLFTGMLPFALGLALGLDTWRAVLFPRFEVGRWLPVAVFSLLALLDFYLIWRVIPPLLSP